MPMQVGGVSMLTSRKEVCAPEHNVACFTGEWLCTHMSEWEKGDEGVDIYHRPSSYEGGVDEER